MNSGLLEDLPTLSRSVCIVYNKVTVRSPNEEWKVSSNKKRYSRANCAKEIGGRPMTSSTPPRLARRTHRGQSCRNQSSARLSR